MKRVYKLSLISFIAINIFFLNGIHAKITYIDTALFYYKYIDSSRYTRVTSSDYDFLRIITSPDPGDKLYNIKDSYKNGNLKLIGKATPRLVTGGGEIAFEGDCITYYKNGKKQSQIHYDDGSKDGEEYLFYPNGKVYTLKKTTLVHTAYVETKYWECYDKNGEQTCKAGEGLWLMYEKDFKTVSIKGPVRKGQFEGEWKGSAIVSHDTVKYVYNYKNSFLNSATGYDKSGKAYPFKNDIEPAHYWSGPFNFLRAVQSHLELPKDDKGEKMSADNIFVTFVIEKDGHITELAPSPEADPKLKDAIFVAFSKCKNWTPRKNYGIPVKAKITLSLKYVTGYSNHSFVDEIYYGEQQLDD